MAGAWCDRIFFPFIYFLFAGERKFDLYSAYQKTKLLATFQTERWCETANNSIVQCDMIYDDMVSYGMVWYSTYDMV